MQGSLLQRFWWRFLRASGFQVLSWDKQFEAGVWSRGVQSPHTIRRVSELCNGGRIVEFGCGEGKLPQSLPDGCFSEYFGFDISHVAIDTARKNARDRNLSNLHFDQCDMANWAGLSSVSLIVAEECLYYLPPAVAETFLRRCCDSLCDGGAILVIVHSATKHASTLALCRRVCDVVDERSVDSRVYLTLKPQEQLTSRSSLKREEGPLCN